MKTYNDCANLTSFEFWSGAKDHEFTYSELQEIEIQIEEIYPEGINETTLNDLFCFEEETLCEWIGVDYQEYLER